MTPEEKAEELYVGFWHLTNDSRIAIKCALKAVDEIMIHSYRVKIPIWEEVKQEIQKL